MPSDIRVFQQDVSFDFPHSDSVCAWIEKSVIREGKSVGEISFILCSDEYLLDMNIKYLNHDFYTDVITFDYTTEAEVSGDVFISLDRVRDNASRLGSSLFDELHRVMIHGILHLCGYSDKTDEKQKEMRMKEDYYLSLRSF